ncbi:MAG: hypothetical protein MZU97_18975 [Bacillus subtilis]|nr:hypothetical protein [Bacillus subtilis]
MRSTRLIPENSISSIGLPRYQSSAGWAGTADARMSQEQDGLRCYAS